MPRVARKSLDSEFLHVMVQGINKEFIFENDEYIKIYLNTINRFKEKYNFTILAYCIMNNHAHFVIFTENIKEFGDFMHDVNLAYAQKYNIIKDRYGVLFRNRYRAEAIKNESYLINCIKYVHRNPVKAGIVEKCEDYKYSSYNEYISNGDITKAPIMQEMFGSKCNYKELFGESYNIKFMDLNEDEDVEEYIVDGIKMFTKNKDVEVVELIKDKETFKNLIKYLKNDCNISYKQSADFFNISRWKMSRLNET